MAEAAVLNMRVKISDPKPAYCAGCHAGAHAALTFVDFDAAFDAGQIVNQEGAVLVGCDDLHLCEQCVREAAEALDLKPTLHSSQEREIARLQTVADHWKAYAARLQDALRDRPETPEPRRPAAGRR